MDLSVTPLKWAPGPKMVQPRIQMNATILPNGKVLASGGSVKDEDVTTAVKQAEIYDPATRASFPPARWMFPESITLTPCSYRTVRSPRSAAILCARSTSRR